LARRAKPFVLLGDGKELYHRSPSGIPQRCIPIAGGQELLREIHSGAYGHHAAPRALAGNASRQGFYWPTAVADATRIVRTCEGCQFYARQTHLPAQALQVIPITWPFAVWGLDLVGPVQKAPGGLHAPLGRVVRHRQSSEARNEQDGRQTRRGLQQRLEHPTATSLLPLRCFQVVRIPRSHAKFSHQGRVSLASAKPDPPSGAKRGNPLCVKFSSKKDPFCQNAFRAFRLLRKWILKTTEYT
jgi:hypothetical protein